MIKLEKTKVVGWEEAIRGMRNPMNSWKRSDSVFSKSNHDGTFSWFDACGGCLPPCSGVKLGEVHEDNITGLLYEIGPNDHDLMMRLAAGGPVHAKYRRMIVAYVDITAPLYWWKEFDTYKVGTVANSCSTMHKIHEKEFTLEDFSCEHVTTRSLELLMRTIKYLNECRDLYVNYETHDNSGYTKPTKKEVWWQMIQLLPSSYNQKRTVMLNYEVLAGIYEHRKNHKLDEWVDFCKWIEKLPYSEIIIGEKKEDD